MKPKLTVVKLGGNCMDDDALLESFLASFCRLPDPKILVHGGGKLATSLSRQLNIPAQMIAGRRVTCAQTLQVVTMVYAGIINKQLTARLQAMQCNATGLCGTDGNLVSSVQRSAEPVDYGFVGDPVAVNTSLLKLLLDSGYTPVVASITHNGDGQLLNTNADTVASFIAAALTAHYDVHLLFAFDKKGVLADPLDEESVIAQLSKAEAVKMKNENKITDGMLPKLSSGFSALENNVSCVSIRHLSSLEAVSTTLTL